ncbi:APC family permease [Bacillus sp. 03113]|uniref:APC family permease n=1 Tax=Bacillus sp. 03113 TaxID=2578211 RepID=UPI001141A196|nr:APC family permease [Bacillus sp. 03113]
MNQRKIGSLTLSGLIIGPLLGSGIILLPSIIYDTSGDYAIFAWLIMSIIGLFFAYLCGELTLMFPGEAGIGNAIEQAFGQRMKNLSSIFLMIAAFMGPIAVMMTAAEYLTTWLFDSAIKAEWIAIVLLILSGLTLLFRLSFLGNLSLVISSLAVLILTSGSAFSLLFHHRTELVSQAFHAPSFGHSLLLLFWIIVGWEIIGNYSAEVKNPKQTIRKAIFISAFVITIVNLLIAGAVQWTDFSGAQFSIKLTGVLYPLFGGLSIGLLTIVAVGLCLTTYLMIAGGVSRLIASLAQTVSALHFLTRKSRNGAPVAGIILLIMIHLTVATLVLLHIVTVEKLVALANAFFIANALIGIFAAIKLFKRPLMKGIAVSLSLLFSLLLLRSSVVALTIIAVLTILFMTVKKGSTWMSMRKVG